MCEAMIHRGPDFGRVTAAGPIVLGHRRLSIIDLSINAAQPMQSDDGRYFIVYNGEVYNFMALRKRLVEAGCRFRTHSDTEVVLYAYILWGRKCVEEFNGMFALAIWDARGQELFLARDHFGKKPLYYHLTDAGISFASELSALACDGEVPRKPSMEALNCYLALGYILAPLTLYEGVQMLEPGTSLTVSKVNRRGTMVRYWDFASAFEKKTAEGEDEIAQHLLLHIDGAVKARMVSDVPVGAFLSGGVDSASVVALMKKHHAGPLLTFSMGFDEESYNELPDAARAARWFGTEHHEQVVRCDSRESMDRALDAYDEPFADTSLIPTVALSRLASTHVKVALSGDGADELFAGYITYTADRLHRFARRIPAMVLRSLGILCAAGGSHAVQKMDWRYKAKQFLAGAAESPEKAHYMWRLIFSPEERMAILGEKHRDLIYDTDPFHRFARHYGRVRELHWLDKNLYVDCMTWLPNDILVKVDRASMRSSLETRSPYLDVSVASYAASIPAALKMKGSKKKYILKKALADVLPPFVLEKKKEGFSAPVGRWIGAEGVDEYKSFNRYVFGKKVKL